MPRGWRQLDFHRPQDLISIRHARPLVHLPFNPPAEFAVLVSFLLSLRSPATHFCDLVPSLAVVARSLHRISEPVKYFAELLIEKN